MAYVITHTCALIHIPTDAQNQFILGPGINDLGLTNGLISSYSPGPQMCKWN